MPDVRHGARKSRPTWPDGPARGRRAGSGPDAHPGAERSGLLVGTLPGVVTVELFADPPNIHLYPEEADRVKRAIDRRRREFATVRLCARTALARLGVPPGPILPGPGGEPAWPAGVVGSMTHCPGYRAAAVARTAAVAAVGIDAEPNSALPSGIERMVASPGERRTLDRLTLSHPAVAWDRLLFSAKESTYKTCFPLLGRMMDFSDCTITPDPERGTFTSSLHVPGPVVGGRRVDTFTGHWRTVVREGVEYVATGIAVPAAPDPAAGWR
ncbi:4'-phosphopantetheinyl transferase (plasmid) [Streptomyces globosus]|uniref:4'-phosphopantetheinyl transferase n=1 Tax=Streptomyces globosus TaxID=68209 RepID=A0A344UBP7_9ACTN|nr:4'-phosphopantetheinyl transferase [Streptomyces globosus]